MPVERCTENGQSGFRWGREGKCFTGEGARARAERQGRAIEAAKRRRVGRVTVAFLVGGVVALAFGWLALHLMNATMLSGCQLAGTALELETGTIFEGYICHGGLRLLVPDLRKPPEYGV